MDILDRLVDKLIKILEKYRLRRRFKKLRERDPFIYP